MAVRLVLDAVSKSFGATRVLQGFSLELNEGDRVALQGSNGSGKSTVIKILSGQNSPSKGLATLDGCGPADWPRCVSLAAPYTELLEELTPREHLHWQSQFQALRLEPQEALQALDLSESAWDRPIQSFSSGMKQRMKLATALLANTPVVLLDEPLSNLDDAGRAWAVQLVEAQLSARAPWGERILVIATNNDSDELGLTRRSVPLHKF
jgi:heme exporter protein A